MESISEPALAVHRPAIDWIRLVVAAALAGLIWLLQAENGRTGTTIALVVLVTIGISIWTGVRHAGRPTLDGLLTGFILGVGFGALLGYQAYQVSDVCIFVECEKDIGAFWSWAIGVLLLQLAIGAAVGSIGAGKGKAIPGFEDLPAPAKRP